MFRIVVLAALVFHLNKGGHAIVAETALKEDRKGSLEVGKLADLVILDHNPLKVDPMTIRDIRVVETMKEGKAVFKRSTAP